VRFWIDNVLVLDKVQQADSATYSVVAVLTPGRHAFPSGLRGIHRQRAL